MTLKDQQIAVAQLNGWKTDHANGHWYRENTLPEQSSCLSPGMTEKYATTHEDLDEAILKRKDDQDFRDSYVEKLGAIVERDGGDNYGYDSVEGFFWLANASVAQRREALLKVKGVWHE
jgi:hypothetical protein